MRAVNEVTPNTKCVACQSDPGKKCGGPRGSLAVYTFPSAAATGMNATLLTWRGDDATAVTIRTGEVTMSCTETFSYILTEI